MPAHFKYSQFLAFPGNAALQMLAAGIQFFCKYRCIQVLPGLYEMFDFAENKRMAYCRSSNHYPVSSVSIYQVNSFLRRINIPVSKNRNFQPWVFLYFAYPGPVSLAGVHLVLGTAMDGNSLYSYVLQSFSHFHNPD